MDPLTPTANDAYLRYADLLVRYQCLLAQGKQDAEETESLEEEMNKAWESLDPGQRKSLSGLASDLNWVRDKGAPPPRGPRAEDVSPEDFQAVIKAKNDKDWHLMLCLLRHCSLRIPVFQLAWLRGVAWEELKEPRIAWLFYNFAVEAEPGNRPAAIADR
jgi:hypothetical protein